MREDYGSAQVACTDFFIDLNEADTPGITSGCPNACKCVKASRVLYITRADGCSW